MRVEQVLLGGAEILGRDIVVADSSKGLLERIAARSALAFLRNDGDDVYWPVAFEVSRVTAANEVELVVPGRSTVPLSELAGFVRRVPPVRLSWSGRAQVVGGPSPALHVEILATNRGSRSAAAFPPSWCASVKAYPLEADGRWHLDKARLFAQPDGWFRALDETEALVPAASSHVFRYDIPLAALEMTRAGPYDIVLGMTQSFCHRPEPDAARLARFTRLDAGAVDLARLPAPRPRMRDQVLRVEVTAAMAALLAPDAATATGGPVCHGAAERLDGGGAFGTEGDRERDRDRDRDRDDERLRGLLGRSGHARLEALAGARPRGARGHRDRSRGPTTRTALRRTKSKTPVRGYLTGVPGKIPAASYSPTRLPVQYHRLRRA